MSLTKLKKFLDSLEFEELIELYKITSTNNQYLINEIKQEIFEKNAKNHKVCSVCGTPLSDNYFELIFGNITLRKRAYFCGKDCVQYFLNTLDNKTTAKDTENKVKNTDLKESNESSYEKTEKIKKPLPKLKPRTEIKKRDKKTALHSLKTLPERIFNLFF